MNAHLRYCLLTQVHLHFEGRQYELGAFWTPMGCVVPLRSLFYFSFRKKTWRSRHAACARALVKTFHLRFVQCSRLPSVWNMWHGWPWLAMWFPHREWLLGAAGSGSLAAFVCCRGFGLFPWPILTRPGVLRECCARTRTYTHTHTHTSGCKHKIQRVQIGRWCKTML